MAHTTSTSPSTVPFFPFPFHYLSCLDRSFSVHRPLGGDSGIKHQHYTARENIAIVGKICRIKRETNVSYCQVAESVGVLYTLVICWHALRERYNNIDIKTLPRYSAYHSPCGQLEHQRLLTPASHGAKVCPCALYGDVLLFEKTLHCLPHGDEGVTASPR